MRRITPDMPFEIARRIHAEEAGDLKARLMLNHLAEKLYDVGAFAAACTLIHAGEYLADRTAYERAPWPKGQIKIPGARPRCSHGF